MNCVTHLPKEAEEIVGLVLTMDGHVKNHLEQTGTNKFSSQRLHPYKFAIALEAVEDVQKHIFKGLKLESSFAMKQEEAYFKKYFNIAELFSFQVLTSCLSSQLLPAKKLTTNKIFKSQHQHNANFNPTTTCVVAINI